MPSPALGQFDLVPSAKIETQDWRSVNTSGTLLLLVIDHAAVLRYNFMVLIIEIHLKPSRIYNNELKIGTVVQLL